MRRVAKTESGLADCALDDAPAAGLDGQGYLHGAVVRWAGKDDWDGRGGGRDELWLKVRLIVSVRSRRV